MISYVLDSWRALKKAILLDVQLGSSWEFGLVGEMGHLEKVTEMYYETAVWRFL